MYFQSLQISGPSRKDAGSSGCGRQPPGRPGTALDELVVTRGGKSSRWYIFPMEEASSRPAGPELPWGAGWPPREGRAADGTSSPWRRPAAARPARSCPGELGGHQGREEQPMVHLPHGGGRQPPGRPGATLGSWVATKGGKSSRWYIFPMEAAGSRQASPELSWRAGWPPWKRRADGCAIFPMEEEGSHIRKGVRYYLTPFFCRSTPLRVTVSDFYCSCASGLDWPGLPPRLFIFSIAGNKQNVNYCLPI